MYLELFSLLSLQVSGFDEATASTGEGRPFMESLCLKATAVLLVLISNVALLIYGYGNMYIHIWYRRIGSGGSG